MKYIFKNNILGVNFKKIVCTRLLKFQWTFFQTYQVYG